MSTLESERLDRIEQHLKLLKEDSNIRSADIKEIKQALLGNALNDYKGLVWKISDIDNRVQNLEEQEGEMQVYIKQAKVLIVAFIAALATLLVKAFTK
jgi:chromosome segregation ATPase